ncbi:unnamed protein product [Prunus armeniaca]|uniref:Uncharacterized protein n=1 Tax=Prunus armeniaca TaxID=36596 RepID=A0A6J5UIG2_PRUAR|nr:unnamed protein product [Prunus armeniaca]CAB4306725.1 unnamed protein product [Prunus armeniaca]
MEMATATGATALGAKWQIEECTYLGDLKNLGFKLRSCGGHKLQRQGQRARESGTSMWIGFVICVG